MGMSWCPSVCRHDNSRTDVHFQILFSPFVIRSAKEDPIRFWTFQVTPLGRCGQCLTYVKLQPPLNMVALASHNNELSKILYDYGGVTTPGGRGRG